MHIAAGVAPSKLDAEWPGPGAPEAEVEVRAPLAGVPVAPVHLAHQPSAVRQMHGGLGADGGPTKGVRSGVAGTGDNHPRLARAERKPKMEPQEAAARTALIPVEARRPPLIGHREVQPAVAVDVGDGDAATHRGLGEPQFPRNVDVSAMGAPHEEWIAIASAQVVARLEAMPAPGVGQQLVVAHG